MRSEELIIKTSFYDLLFSHKINIRKFLLKNTNMNLDITPQNDAVTNKNTQKQVKNGKAELEKPHVYREAIKATATATGRYIKQSGGSGYYGVVVMRFEPMSTGGYEFTQEVFGGSVPRGYWPAVDKGLQDTLEHGVLAGFPVIGVRGVLTDGKYHAVDSNELAFKLAAGIAFKEACKTAKPTILEPIYKVEVTTKDEYLGDVLGDMNKRRGRVLGMEPAITGYQKVIAEAPEQEISKYTIDLKAMTQGSGTFSREFLRYEEVPGNLIAKIVEEHKLYLEEQKNK
jgi:elongation factor G